MAHAHVVSVEGTDPEPSPINVTPTETDDEQFEICNSLGASQCRDINNLICEYSDVFSSKPGITSTTTHLQLLCLLDVRFMVYLFIYVKTLIVKLISC